MARFMKIDSIAGTEKGKYAGWIRLISVGISGAMSFRDREGRRRQELHVEKEPDITTPSLFELWKSGEPRNVTVKLEANKGLRALTIRLKEAEVVSVQFLSSQKSDKMIEQIRFSSTDISFDPESAADGLGTEVVWKLPTN